jgi:hypothetical protein
MAINQRIFQILYGIFFVVLFPSLLVAWAWCLDRSAMKFWPIPFQPWVGKILIFVGLLFMLISMRALWVMGKGLPMNAWPPTHYVSNSTYSLLSHPIYGGFVSVVGGVSIVAGSPAGLWIVTPVTTFAVMALVAGYEGPRLRERFKGAVHYPLIGVPDSSPTIALWRRRLSATAIALCPWAVLYSTLSVMPAPEGAQELRMAWEYHIPKAVWAIWIYSAAYLFAIAGPLLLRTHADLRRYVISAWLATLCGLIWILFAPSRAEFLPLAANELETWIFDVNRLADAEWLALPSFHVIWAVLAAYCFRNRFERLTPVWILIAIAICLSCILTGSHAMVDVLGGVILGVLCWRHEQVWRWLVGCAESLSNSWTALQYGPIRIISHALWSGIAAMVGILIVVWLASPALIGEMVWVFTVALLSAGVWGYWLEGGTRLSRPFGYYGFLFGAIFGLSIVGFIDISATQCLMAAFACGAPLAQAIGRLRCLVQGCCHGRPVSDAFGIRVVNPNSRVTALSGLHGVPIYPTQLYSIVGNLLIFVCLWRLWHWEAPATFIGGFYLVLSSLARFFEERYRGEPQTLVIFDLSIYQWLAAILFLAGIVVSMVNGMPVRIAGDMTWGGVLIALIAGLIAAFCMSVDFPFSQRRFSRLTVGGP